MKDTSRCSICNSQK